MFCPLNVNIFFKVVMVVGVIGFVCAVIGQILVSISEKRLRKYWQNKQ